MLPAGISKPTIDERNTADLRTELPQPISNNRTNTPRNSQTRERKEDTALEYVEVLYDFEAENDGEMSMSKGEVIAVIEHIDDGWWLGECDGRKGLFPANYVKRTNGSNSKPKSRSDHGQRIKNSNSAVTVLRCSECGCEEFTANVFKPRKCNNCFHEH